MILDQFSVLSSRDELFLMAIHVPIWKIHAILAHLPKPKVGKKLFGIYEICDFIHYRR